MTCSINKILSIYSFCRICSLNAFNVLRNTDGAYSCEEKMGNGKSSHKGYRGSAAGVRLLAFEALMRPIFY